jgi:mycothiol synthase
MVAVHTPDIIEQPFHSDADFWRVHQLLIDTYPISPLGLNWDIRRWEGWRFYNASPHWNSVWEQQVRLWSQPDGQVIGAVLVDHDEIALQVRPENRSIEEDMIAWAEAHLAQPIEGGIVRAVSLFVMAYDTLRTAILERRGYERTSEGGVVRRMVLEEAHIPWLKLADGYSLRSVNRADMQDCQRIADLLNASFGRTFHNAREFYNFTKLAPCYRRELDLVAIAPDGTFAAYVGVPYDTVHRRGIFEPVCTHPDHRQRRLAQVLMFEGLRRLQSIGAHEVTVETGDMIPANRLYDSIGFTEVVKGVVWRRTF